MTAQRENRTKKGQRPGRGRFYSPDWATQIYGKQGRPQLEPRQTTEGDYLSERDIFR
jgi:hypothetical protein